MFEDEGSTNQINSLRSSTQFSEYNNSKSLKNYQSCDFGSSEDGDDEKIVNSLSNKKTD